MRNILTKLVAAAGVFTLAAAATATAHAQFPGANRLKHGSLSLGGTGQFSTILTQNLQPVTINGSTYTNQQQYTTGSVGFLGSYQFNPVSWAGVEVNYGFNHYREEYGYQVSGNLGTRQGLTKVTTDTHEATAAYIFHAKKLPLQPYVGIGGGAIDFNPRRLGDTQWRGAGLLETGFDFAVPQTGHHLSFRVAGRSLYYRSPNFYSSAVSTRSWRVTSEPYVAAVYRF